MEWDKNEIGENVEGMALVAYLGPRPSPSRRLARTETVAFWPCKQASDGNHIISKTDISANLLDFYSQPLKRVPIIFVFGGPFGPKGVLSNF